MSATGGGEGAPGNAGSGSPAGGDGDTGDRARAAFGLADFLTLGVTMALLTGGGTLLGIFLDDRFGTGPWLTFGGLGLGVVLAVVAMVVDVRKYL